MPTKEDMNSYYRAVGDQSWERQGNRIPKHMIYSGQKNAGVFFGYKQVSSDEVRLIGKP